MSSTFGEAQLLINNLNSIPKVNELLISNLSPILENKFLQNNLITEIKKVSSPDNIAKISETIMNYYLEKNMVPSQNFLDAIQINQTFTLFLQHNNYYNQINKKYFQQQINSLFQDIYQQLDEDNFSRGFEQTEEVLAFFAENIEYIDTNYFVNNFLALTRQFNHHEFADKTMPLLLQLIQIIPNKDTNNLNNIYFELLWFYIGKEKYVESFSLVKQLDLLKTRYHILDTRFKFWIAYLLAKNDEEKLASTIYNEIVTADPFNYYAVIASALNKDNNLQIPIKKKTLSQLTLKTLLNDKQIIEHLQKIKIYLDLKQINLAKDAISDLLNYRQGVYQSGAGQEDFPMQQDLVSLLAKFLSANKKYLETFKLLNYRFKDNNFMLDEVLLRAIFPQEFQQLIYNSVPKIDIPLILSIIRQESAFNPRAKSKAGAMGLMQVMPNTARRMTQHFSANQLYHPQTNIKIGVAYLEKMLHRFEQNPIYALAAYNAGPQRLARWKERHFTSSNPLLHIEMIPFNETRNYIQYILRNYYFYTLIYQGDEQHAANKIANLIRERP